MQVRNLIIHAIDKQTGTNAAVVQARSAALAIDDKAIRFVETALNLFDRQAKGLLFAGFTQGAVQEIFQNYLSAYCTQKKTSFLQFSTKCAQHLADTMKMVNFATGGFLIMAEATVESEDRLCILLLSQEGKFAVDQATLSLIDVPTLNLERMGVGCIVSLTKWMEGANEPVTYVRGSREVSRYFMRFIGAEAKKTPKDASRELVEYTTNFLTDKDIEGEDQIDRMRRLHEYCAKQFKANEPIELSVVGAIVFQEDQNEYCRAANSQGISSEFHIDTKYLKSLLRIEYKTKGVTLKLERSVIRDNVEVDVKKSRLILKNVDEKTIAEISEALGDE